MWYSDYSIKRKQHFFSLIAMTRCGQPLRCGCFLPNIQKLSNRLPPSLTKEVVIFKATIGCPLHVAEKSRALLLRINLLH